MNETVVKVIDLVPGNVRPIITVEADSLSEEVFWHSYVAKHTPVLIKGAANHWPALEKWKQPGYLDARCDDQMVSVSRTFNASPPLAHAAEQSEPLAECIAQMREASENATFSVPAMEVPPAWLSDLGEYHFLDKYDRAALGYPGKRIFFYKNASTEWHYHQMDETLTTQLVGAKRISLFRLTPENWQTYAPLIKANYHHMPCSELFFPADIPLNKYEGVIEAGDAVYIPPFWWHGVDPASSELGLTLAQCFRSPVKRLGAWNEPVTRELVANTMKFNTLRTAPLLALICLSSLSRAMSKENWLQD